MKTAISVPDKTYKSAEKLAKKLGTSRSQLYAQAMEEYLLRHDTDAMTEGINAALDGIDTALDPALAAAQFQTFKKVEW